MVTDPENPQTALILPDIHYPYHDIPAIDTAINYALNKKINTLVLLGDCVDNYSISPWKKDPSRRDLNEERETVIDELTKLTGAFPVAKKYWIEGNHELWLRNLVWSKVPELANLLELDITQVYKMDRLGINYISNTELLNVNLPVFRLGKLYLVHGHEVYPGRGGMLKNVARIVYYAAHVNIICGHWHFADKHLDRKLDQDFTACWALGCLCNLRPHYKPHNRWVHGFAIVEYTKDWFNVESYQIIDGRVFGS